MHDADGGSCFCKVRGSMKASVVMTAIVSLASSGKPTTEVVTRTMLAYGGWALDHLQRIQHDRVNLLTSPFKSK